MSSPEVEIILTEDGSHTLFVPSLDETYHSTHGAIQESKHIFLKNGLEHLIDSGQLDKVNILEIGFGTGLNALLTNEFSRKNPETTIQYTTLEPNPLSDQVIQNLNYHKQAGLGNREWQKIHNASWGDPTVISKNFKFQKLQTAVEDFKSDQTFDLIYFDAFAPGKQPAIWDKSIFKILYLIMNSGGILTTYCAQGKFKRTLKSIGFNVESLPGPPGKMQMVRASKG
jgi:tRNA U34 5-methylaminomethyl-2-thiouridine-forming methyltransferase MnmC